MNWNYLKLLNVKRLKTLLIVPYGIETCGAPSIWQVMCTFNCTLWNWNLLFSLLNVHIRKPFNCTLWNWNKWKKMILMNIRKLLIVLYGIETTKIKSLLTWYSMLLIVPYGIETEYKRRWCSRELPFNCTLWNWNRIFTNLFSPVYNF